MVHLESDTDEVEINSGNSVDTAGDPEDIEFNIGNDMSSQQGKENSNDYKCISDLTDDDIRGMKFSTEIEATKFYELYAHLHGFAVRKDDVQRDCENRIVMRQLLCNKGTSDGSSRQTMRTGCQAKLRLRYDIVHKNVSVFNPTHNHELTPERFVHLIPKYRKLTEADKQVVDGLHSQGVRTCHIVGYLMGQKGGGHEGLGIIRKDLYNYTDHQARVRIAEGYATLSYFQGKADGDASFFSEFSFTDDGHLENIFWADATSRFDYECFGDVVAFDATYRKNMYGKPLVIFYGYNHHGETTIFDAALVFDETIKTYKWVLNMFSKTMYGKHPKSVITDGDKSMREAIIVVFPNTRHRLCAWHLHRNAGEHVKNKLFLEEFKSLMYSHYTPEKFESEWKRVVDSYGVSNNKWELQRYSLLKNFKLSTRNTVTGKDDASVNPNIAINTDNSNMSRDFGQSARWTHDVRYDVNYFPMHSGIPNNGGYTFPQFSPGGILSSHPNTALHVGTQSVPNYTPHFFPQFSPGGIHSSHSNIVLHSGTQSAHSYTPVDCT
ncbi:hypothetical protein TSUD_319330 [Trifolium subterraneum]|uniref:Uncharacterized protein n=1 Tax=Trifolium subterraneum TaxID=3900 RepID=A0A2Z6LZ08_TRISU|nr:hypothetical protein TSUD_319330 [Trifolium subterraneum]